jgi:hypothetical protein
MAVAILCGLRPQAICEGREKNINKARLCFAATLVIVSIAASVVLIDASDPMVVRLTDKCDPTTFNAVLGAGTCVGDGTITFSHFIREVTSAKKAGAWHFDPAAGTVDEGTVLALENRGGETHTFTKVENFGGGFVAPLNSLSGNPVSAPECATATFGGSFPSRRALPTFS